MIIDRSKAGEVHSQLLIPLGLLAILLVVFASVDATLGRVATRVMAPSEMTLAARGGQDPMCYSANYSNCQTAVDPMNTCATSTTEPECNFWSQAAACLNCSADAPESNCKQSGSLYKSCDTQTTNNGCGQVQTAGCAWNDECGEDCGVCECGSNWVGNGVDCDQKQILNPVACQ